MKLLHGQNLVNELRRQSDKISQRLWVAVPYIGGLSSVRRIIGRNWIENPNVSLRLLADTNEFNNFNSDTIQLFHERGEIKHLAGLHAKIFILDDDCLITSANLTNTAFTRRYEIGIYLEGQTAKESIRVFEEWWIKAERVSLENLHNLTNKKTTSTEERNGSKLQNIHALPPDPGQTSKNLGKKFLNYDSLLEQYKDFASKYQSIQRVWKSQPVFFETDCFLNFLFHDADGKPSNEFQEKPPRRLTTAQQYSEIKKYAMLFKDEIDKGAIHRYTSSSRILRQLLNPRKVKTLTKKDVKQVLDQLNCLGRRSWLRKNILADNSLNDLRHSLDVLVNGKQLLAARMTECNKLKSLGSSSMNEILGFTYPNEYPLINKNSNSGLRFFGYQIKAYV